MGDALMKLINKEKLPSLDFYIWLAEFREESKKWDYEEKKDKKESSKLTLLVALAFLLLFLGTFVNFAFMFGSFCLAVVGLYKVINARNNLDNDEVEDLEDFEIDDTTDLEKYYTDEYKEFLSHDLTEDEFNYKKVVDDQIKKSYDENCILGLDETASVLASQVESYYDMYLLPKSVITSAEWDSLFDNVFALFKEKEITSVFYQTMGAFLRDTLATVLVKKRPILSLSDFVDNIHVINDLVEDSTPVSFTSEELNVLKNRINASIEMHRVEKVKPCKIVNFADYKKKRLK